MATGALFLKSVMDYDGVLFLLPSKQIRVFQFAEGHTL
jgi:hypothetical protein